MGYVRNPKEKRIKCKKCGEEFVHKTQTQFFQKKYCSSECSEKARNEKLKKYRDKQYEKNINKIENKDITGKQKVKCRNCKVIYETYASQIKHRGSKFCSVPCKIAYARKNASIKTLKKRVWKVFSMYTRIRDAIKTTGTCDNVVCITCKRTRKTIEVDAGHFISRKHNVLLYEEKNVHAQCKECNMPPRSGEQYLYGEELNKMYGNGFADSLFLIRERTKRFTKQELCEMEVKYKTKLKELIEKHGSPWASTTVCQL